ncbi:MAG TPA: L-threonylcarbamoyladenylate synthase [Cytophagales bacterium]|nr:L-threonylcarbamoyladenylate synthase [Cytophagales bacterium]
MERGIGNDIKYCKAVLDGNGLVAIPTETVYGLAGNGLSKLAVSKIFEVKKRPFFDPLILHTDSMDKIMSFVDFMPDEAQILAKAIWPGPLTLVLQKKALVPDLVTSGLPTVGVRIPAHPLTLELLSKLDYPLAAPSANPFKYISPTTAQHVQDQLGAYIPYILDGGACTVGVESTILGFEDGVPTVYRFGGLAVESIEALIGTVRILTQNETNPSAPGMLKLHYAPTKKLVVDDLANLDKYLGKRLGLITFTTFVKEAHVCRVLSPNCRLDEAANNLFATMRELDNLDIDLILAERFPDQGLGKAINDRLYRASVKL